jgi:hypothetical protein
MLPTYIGNSHPHSKREEQGHTQNSGIGPKQDWKLAGQKFFLFYATACGKFF